MTIKFSAAILTSLLLFAPAVRGAEGDFAKTLTPEEGKSAGLAKLSPEELARLETLVERYKSGQVVVATQKAVETVRKEEEIHRTEAVKSKKFLPDWVGALITLQRTGEKPGNAQALESRIKGDFDGWSDRTLFRLENGQQWTQMNKESYVCAPPLKSPKVKIFPAAFDGYWLEVEGVNQRCRVKPVKLE